MNPLKLLKKYGQSAWLDFIHRGMLISGEIDQLITDDGISGITSNPSIFEKAIAGSHAYTEAIHALADEGKDKNEIYDTLAVEDIEQAADLLFPIYEQTEGQDGYVSLEVSPYLAHDRERTIKEANLLWQRVNRPNLLIKVPATREGISAIRELISQGINVNVTLLFGLKRYEEIAEAYIEGLEERLASGKSIDRLNSVASFFLSRIDVKVDPLLEEITGQNGKRGEIAKSLHGKVAIASAKIAYEIYRKMTSSDRTIGR